MTRDNDSKSITKSLPLPDDLDPAALVGAADSNLKEIQSAFDVLASVSAGSVVLTGAAEDVEVASYVVEDLMGIARRAGKVELRQLREAISQRQRDEFSASSITASCILECKGRVVRPKTLGQKRYVSSISRNAIAFGVGPAGTGKTYLAMACAIAALHRREVARIVLSRPIIEAGESLGFLPGTLTEKVDPYIRPLYDALFDMVDAKEATGLLQDGVIEIAPLAFMRGRTLNESFVILDEAQNATPEQMKMFLTRLGFGSKMVITGDLSQSDLPGKTSGLKQSLDVLEGIDGIGICRMKSADVVRNPLVSAIISAYEDRGL